MMGRALEENYYALALAILKPITPEEAFRQMQIGITTRNRTLNDQDVEDMIALKEQGLTYKEIGEIYNMSFHAVYKRIKRKKQVL